MGHKYIDGRALADEILTDVGERVAGLKAAGWFPRLVSISVGDNPAAEFYVRNQRRKCERVGIEFEERQYREDITPQELYAAIWALNADPRVTGIIIQRPVPASLSIKGLQAAIDPLKDVEGMHPTSIGNIVYQELDLAPCTAMASVELLRRTGVQLEGLEATIIGHSEIVGKPIAFLLMAEGATVTVCHHMTRDVGMHSRNADAVFVAVGKPDLLNGDMIKPGASVIDIGINKPVDEFIQALEEHKPEASDGGPRAGRAVAPRRRRGVAPRPGVRFGQAGRAAPGVQRAVRRATARALSRPLRDEPRAVEPVPAEGDRSERPA